MAIDKQERARKRALLAIAEEMGLAEHTAKSLAQEILREIRRARSESKKNREKFFTVYAGRDDEGGIAVWTHEANSGSEYIIGRGLFAIYAVNKSFERGILNDGERVDIEKTARLTAEELF